MMKYSVFAQVAVAIVAVVIVFTYVSPTLGTIGELQDDVARFDQAIAQVVTVNAMLDDLVNKMDAISPDDRRALITFMPDHLDELAVMRDISNMVHQSTATLTELSYEGPSAEAFQADSPEQITEHPVGHDFTLAIKGPYDAVKQVVRSLEENDYPIHAYQLRIASAESSDLGSSGGDVELEVRLTTFSMIAPAPSVHAIN